MQALGATPGTGLSEYLFLSLAEGLKLPLEQIARRAELGSIIHDPESDTLPYVQASADAALRLLDSYILSLRLSLEPDERFAVEPVCVSAVLDETCHELAKTARQYGVELELHIQGKYEPVIAHRLALQTALVSLGQTLIEAVPAMGAPQQRLQVAAHRTKHGIVAGMYCDAEELTPHILRQAQELLGEAHQPFVSVSPGSGAGVFVADTILAGMSSHLRVGRFQRQPGFAVTLLPSRQLSFV